MPVYTTVPFFQCDTMILGEMTSEDFLNAVDEKTVVILPIGAVEEHGAHLPLNTDTIQPEKVAADVAGNLEKEGYTVIVAPTVNYGNCHSTANFPGTISISVDSLRSIVYDILTEFMRHGIKNIVVLSGHAGRNHMAGLRTAAEDALEYGNAKIMVLSDYDIAYKDLGNTVPADDGHAGMLETSRVLAIRPELVKMDRAGETHPKFPPYRVLKDAERYFPEGYMGYADRANTELGEKSNESIALQLTEMIRNMIKEEIGE